MDIKQLKGLLVFRFIIYIVILVVISSIAIYLNSTNNSLYEKERWLKNDIDSLKGKLEGLNKKTLEFSEAVKKWESLSEGDKRLNGLRINDAKELIDKMQEKYKLSKVDVTFSKPIELTDDKYKSDNVSIISSDVLISFSSISDEFVFQFINDIETNLPGYVKITTVNISKSSSITPEDLKAIARGEKPDIVTGNIEFLWRDFKYNDVSSNNENKQKDKI